MWPQKIILHNIYSIQSSMKDYRKEEIECNMKHWLIGLVQMQHLDYKSFSFIWRMLFDLTLSRHLNSTHHNSRSPFILCFISSSSHTSYTLYNHFFNPNICPLSFLLNNRIRACSCTSSPLYLTIGISTLICFNNSSADDYFTSAYTVTCCFFSNSSTRFHLGT